MSQHRYSTPLGLSLHQPCFISGTRNRLRYLEKLKPQADSRCVQSNCCCFLFVSELWVQNTLTHVILENTLFLMLGITCQLLYQIPSRRKALDMFTLSIIKRSALILLLKFKKENRQCFARCPKTKVWSWCAWVYLLACLLACLDDDLAISFDSDLEHSKQKRFREVTPAP